MVTLIIRLLARKKWPLSFLCSPALLCYSDKMARSHFKVTPFKRLARREWSHYLDGSLSSHDYPNLMARSVGMTTFRCRLIHGNYDRPNRTARPNLTVILDLTARTSGMATQIYRLARREWLPSSLGSPVLYVHSRETDRSIAMVTLYRRLALRLMATHSQRLALNSRSPSIYDSPSTYGLYMKLRLIRKEWSPVIYGSPTSNGRPFTMARPMVMATRIL